MKVKIYQPTKNAMQSGMANTKFWVLEPEKEDSHFVEPIMGWTGSTDMKQEIRIKFETQDEAIAFAKRSGYEYQVIEPKKRKTKPKSYADNFLK